MKKDEIVAELLNCAKENGMVETVGTAFGTNVKVSISFSKRACETSIDELDFSVRAINAMKRANIFTIGEAIDLIADDGLLRIRNLGKRRRMRSRLLYCFTDMKIFRSTRRECFSMILWKEIAVNFKIHIALKGKYYAKTHLCR